MDKKYTCVSLFSGAGGMDLGFEHSGFNVIWANDIDKDSCNTHKLWSSATVVNKDISKIDLESIPNSDIIIGGFPCFTGNTLIRTKEGYKRIDSVSIGDYVLGCDGKYHIVDNFYNQGKKEIYEIKLVNTDILNTTENHRFYVKRGKKEDIKPEWLSAKDISLLKDSCYVGYPVNQENKIPAWDGVFKKHNQFSGHIEKNLDMNNPSLWYLAGRFIGNGFNKYKIKKGKKLDSGITICCGKHKTENFEKNIKGFKYTKSPDRTNIKYHFSSIELQKFMRQFNCGAFGKSIPSFVLDLPENLLSKFIDGYFDADGSIKKTKNGSYIKNISSVNKGLILNIAECIMKVYKVPCSVRRDKMESIKVIEGRTVNQHDMFVVSWNEKSSQRTSFYSENYMWYLIHSVKPTGRTDNVFDIEVRDVHSFVVENCIAHNCQGFSLAGPRKIDDKRNKLYKFYVSLIELKKPKIFIAENVKGLLTLGDGKIIEAIIKDFSDKGYKVTYKLLDTSRYNVPQKRDRVIIVGIRNDLDIEFNFPEGSDDIITIKQALKGVKTPKKGEVSLEPFSSRFMSRNRKRGWDELSFTIPAMSKQVPLHPSSPDMIYVEKDKWKFGDGKTRRFSYKECAALQTFPKDMDFYGDLVSKYKQIGNAVPVKFAEAIALEVFNTLEKIEEA